MIKLDHTIIIIFLLTHYNVLTVAKPAMSSGLVSPNCSLLFIVIDFVGSLS